MKKTIFLIEEFRLFFEKNRKSANGNLTFKGYSPQKKGAFIFLLVFWQYLRTCLNTGLNNEEYRAFLQSAMVATSGSKNPLLKIIIMIEYLPTSIWRKILWRENIDFMSFESMLRRLTVSQIQAIEENYQDITNGVMPRVIKKSFRDRVKSFFGFITFDQLMAEEYDKEVRNKTKSAWVYNLLGLDFGFGLYFEGINNDTKVNSIDRRFLSVKNHINDFTVNQESGKYWWMYRVVRSNVAFRWYNDVELKSHICPGFWWTLFVHLMFWVISPVGFVWACSMLPKQEHSNVLLLMGAFSLTPFWFVLLTFRGIIELVRLIPSPEDRVGEFVEFVKSDKAIRFYKIIGFIAGGFVAWGLYYLIVPNGIKIGINPFSSFLAWITIIAYGVSTIEYKYRSLYDRSPKWAKFLAGAISFSIGLQLINLYIAHPVWEFITFMANWVGNYPLIALWCVLTIYTVIRMLALSAIAVKDEKKFVQHYNKVMNIAWLEILATVVLFIGNLFHSGGLTFSDFPLTTVFWIFGPVVIVVIVLAIQQYFINPETIEKRSLSNSFVDLTVTYLYGRSYQMSKKDFLKNKWLMNLLPDVAKEKVKNAIDLVHSIFRYSGKDQYSSLRLILLKLNEKLLLELEKNKDKFLGFDDSQIRFILRLLVTGLTFKKAVDIMYKEKIAHERAVAKRKKFFSTIFRPFIWCWEWCLTLKDLWELFNKRCPAVSEVKILE